MSVVTETLDKQGWLRKIFSIEDVLIIFDGEAF